MIFDVIFENSQVRSHVWEGPENEAVLSVQTFVKWLRHHLQS